jgi:hypothetical protein
MTPAARKRAKRDHDTIRTIDTSLDVMPTSGAMDALPGLLIADAPASAGRRAARTVPVRWAVPEARASTVGTIQRCSKPRDLRALADLLCAASDGCLPGDEWNPLQTTEPAFILARLARTAH